MLGCLIESMQKTDGSGIAVYTIVQRKGVGIMNKIPKLIAQPAQYLFLLFIAQQISIAKTTLSFLFLFSYILHFNSFPYLFPFLQLLKPNNFLFN